MNEEYNLGMAGGIFFALLIVMIWRIIQHIRGTDTKQEYDERQQFARGIAYRNGFHCLGTYLVLYGVLDLFGISLCETYVGMMIGIMLGALVFAVTAIRHDAYLALHDKGVKMTRLGLLLAAANLIPGILACINGTILRDGKLAAPSVSLMLGVLWLVLMVTYHTHERSRAAEAQEEP